MNFGRIACSIAALAGLLVATATAQTGALSTAQLLVDLARDQGLSTRAEPTPSDERIIQALLAGALRLEPANLSALEWSHELAAARNDRPAALRFLETLARSDPRNDAAFLQWLQAGHADVQSVEQRRAWLTGLASADTPHRQALVALSLAELALSQLDRGECVRQIARARELWADVPGAAGLEWAALPRDANPAQRLRVRLAQLRERPADVELAWEVALALDALDLPGEATAFYEHAQRIHDSAQPDRALPTEQLLDLALHALRLNRPTAALELARQAHEHEALSLAPAFLLHWLLMQADRQNEAQAIKDALAKRVADLRDPGGAPAFVAAEAAWFLCRFEPDPARALKLAESAAQRSPGDPFVLRVLGFAQAEAEKPEHAMKTLEPLAAGDAYAAGRLAQLALAQQDSATACKVLAAMTSTPSPGPAAAYFNEICKQAGQPQAAASQPDGRDEASKLVTAFDAEVLKSAQMLDQALTAEMEAPASFDPGEPWWVTFRLTNRGRHPIALGAGAAINPIFLVSARVDDGSARDFPYLFTVNLDSRLALAPGEALAVRRTVDVGPLRRANRRAPQNELKITLTAIFDPVQSGTASWRPARVKQAVAPITFTRGRIAAAQIDFLLRATREGDERARFSALGLLGDLLGEAQRLEAGSVRYTCATVPKNNVQSVLRSALESPDWQTRTRALEGLLFAGLDRDLVTRAEACLKHDHWLVRIAATRLLARQGRGFLASARKLADEDVDELVRDIARGVVEQIEALRPEGTAP